MNIKRILKINRKNETSKNSRTVLDTKNFRREIMSGYIDYFKEKEKGYLKILIGVIIAIALSIITIVMCIIKGNTFSMIVNIIMTILWGIAIIVYETRYIDSKKVSNNKAIERKTRMVFKKITGNEINGIYCKMYIDDLNKEIVKNMYKGGEYEIVYLDNTMGKYIIDIKEIKKKGRI